jgi:hypothetical protein
MPLCKRRSWPDPYPAVARTGPESRAAGFGKAMPSSRSAFDAFGQALSKVYWVQVSASANCRLKRPVRFPPRCRPHWPLSGPSAFRNSPKVDKRLERGAKPKGRVGAESGLAAFFVGPLIADVATRTASRLKRAPAASVIARAFGASDAHNAQVSPARSDLSRSYRLSDQKTAYQGNPA